MPGSWDDDARNALSRCLAVGYVNGPVTGFEHLRPLHLACLLSDVALIDAVLAAGAETETTTAAGMTALQICLLRGRTDLVRRLIEAGADVPYRTEDEVSAHPTLVHPAFFLLAGDQCDLDLLALLVRSKEDAEACDATGNSLLNTAILNGHGKVAHLLLDREAAPNMPDATTLAPLHCAVAAGLPDVAKRLITLGADVNPTYERSGPLYISTVKPEPEIAALLLAAGADPNRPGGTLGTPALVAAREYLRRLNDPYNETDAAGADAYRRVLALLVRAGASLETRPSPREPTLRETLTECLSSTEMLEITMADREDTS